MPRVKPGLTTKQKLFVKAKIDNPKISNTDAAMIAFNTKDRHSASVVGYNTAHNPTVQMALAEHNELFESAIVGTVRDWKDSDVPRKREIALNAAMFGHDKVHGKATTRIETHSEIVKISINLTGDNEEAPPDDEILDLTANLDK